jgi:hypothetical protein
MHIAALLRRTRASWQTLTTAFLERVALEDDSVARCYTASARIAILEVGFTGEQALATFDLRHDRLRTVVPPPSRGHVFLANLLAGVVEGEIERLILEDVLAALGDTGRAVVSTSSVFEAAEAEGVPLLVLPKAAAELGELSPDVRTRLMADVDAGTTVVAPARSVPVGDQAHYAWWRMDPVTGETVACTGDGLHGAAPEKPKIETTLAIGHIKVLDRVVFIFNIMTAQGRTQIVSTAAAGSRNADALLEWFLSFNPGLVRYF